MPPEKQTPESCNARVAELVDAADSKSAVRKDVLVRFQSRALKKPFDLSNGFFYCVPCMVINSVVKVHYGGL